MSRFIVLIVAIFCLTPTAQAQSFPPADDTKIVRFTILQMNDVYEINPLSQGKVAGLARVATVRKELLKKNENTLTVLAGDLLSPSPMGNSPAKAPWKGKQMVDVMNTLGLDLAVLGNHEFDIKKDQLLERLNESRFPWISANVFDEDWKPFPKVAEHWIRDFKSPSGVVVRVGFVGVTVASNDADYVRYRDPHEIARQQVKSLAGQVDLMIALTHLDLVDDIRLAETVSGIHFIIGGHEHEANYVDPSFPYLPPIAKADANAKTVWVHNFAFDTVGRTLKIDSELKDINPQIPDDPETAKVIDRWTNDYANIFRDELGLKFAPYKIKGDKKTPALPTDDVVQLKVRLEGRDAFMRTQPTNLGQFIAETLRQTLPAKASGDERPRVAVFNSGSVRIDDVIEANTPLTFYDVMRILPYPGEIRHTTINGALLKRILDQSESEMKDSGGYLQYSGLRLEKEKDVWLVQDDGDKPIDPTKMYFIAMGDYLFSGRQKGYEYLQSLKREDGPVPIDLQTTVAKQLANSPDIKDAAKVERRPIVKNRVAFVHVGPALIAPPIRGLSVGEKDNENKGQTDLRNEPRDWTYILLGIQVLLLLTILANVLMYRLRRESKKDIRRSS